ncbi:ComEA family DNA-binding protein [Actinocorallia longicatena]|uniref:ComEA family DNA-binding protein n=1 Tax=Actinocorallia longicatena TaxID=111803 RepID=UPI0031D7774D
MEAILNSAIVQYAGFGWRIETRYRDQAVLVRGGTTNHVAHALATFLMCGLWLPVWVVFAVADAPKRVVLSVDAYGQVHAGGAPFTAPPAPRFNGNQHAIAVATMRRRLRQESRELSRDTILARDLRIGRPDLPRHYDDGGLIDINHVPAATLTAITGITPELAEHIVTVREHVTAFASAEELSAVAQLPPHLTPEIVEYGLFLP